MFTLDPKTLALLIAFSNILFAALATLYIANLHPRNLALETWRWAKVTAACGLIANLTHSSMPGMVPVMFGNWLHLLASTIELSAYCILLGRRSWIRPLAFYAGAALLLYQVLDWRDASENQRLLASSLASGWVSAMMAIMLLQKRGRDLLPLVIGLADAVLALILLVRAGTGMFIEPLVRFNDDPLTLTLYLASFGVLIINGFGFLLLAKQDDDRTLRRALDDLLQVEVDQRVLLSVASHEFRTPAAKIKASLDSLNILNDQVPPVVARRLENIRLSASRLTELANTLITQDRLNEQCLTPHQAEFDLYQMVDEVVRGSDDRVIFRSLLPKPALPMRADESLLRITLHNLIDNALEHHPAGVGPVVVSLARELDHADIRVADLGQGIPDSEKKMVFRRFHSTHGDFARGIGLSIVHTVALAHGGSVAVEDHPPQGSVFILRLPLGGGDLGLRTA